MFNVREYRFSRLARCVLAGILSTLVFVVVPGGASADPGTSSSVKTEEIELTKLDSSIDLKKCKKVGQDKSWGAMGGKVCWDPTSFKGWVKDKKDDDWCVVVVVKWWKGDDEAGEEESPEACEKDQHEEFESMPEDMDADKVTITLKKKKKEEEEAVIGHANKG